MSNAIKAADGGVYVITAAGHLVSAKGDLKPGCRLATEADIEAKRAAEAKRIAAEKAAAEKAATAEG